MKTAKAPSAPTPRRALRIRKSGIGIRLVERLDFTHEEPQEGRGLAFARGLPVARAGAEDGARNGHLSALSQGVGASDAPAAFPTPETESPSNAAAEADENKKSAISPSVLYALDVISDRGAGADEPAFVSDHARFRVRQIPDAGVRDVAVGCHPRGGALQHRQALEISLRTLKKIGVEGVMTDVWWGIVERDGPEIYDWTAYLELLDLVERAGLKLNAVMSFHACGANVGDYFKVTLPPWVLEAASADPDLFFTDQYGYRNPECISLWADNAMTLHGRTPLESYRDYALVSRRRRT